MITCKKLIITIDTEEDNWGCYDNDFFTTENIQRVPYLQEILDELGFKPTYLVTYPIANDEKSVSILKKILDEGRCEIGAHCHPWNTPPFEEEKNSKNSMLCNLPSRLQFEKIMTLHNTIRNNFGIEAVGFRAGRYGFDKRVAKNLYRLGYRIDTSVTPFVDWSKNYGPDFSSKGWKPFRFSVDDISPRGSNSELLEVPATIDYIPRNISIAKVIYRILEGKSSNLLKWKLFLTRLKLMRKIWLSPEVSTVNMQVNLLKNLIIEGGEIFNMVFHSTSLLFGLSPFNKNKIDEKRFLENIRKVIKSFRDRGVASIKLSDILEMYDSFLLKELD